MSLPLPHPEAKSASPSPSEPRASYESLRRAFAASLRANCSASPNVHFGSDAATAALSADPPRFFTDASAGPGAGLTSAGMRRLAAGWEEQLRRLARTPDGQV